MPLDFVQHNDQLPKPIEPSSSLRPRKSTKSAITVSRRFGGCNGRRCSLVPLGKTEPCGSRVFEMTHCRPATRSHRPTNETSKTAGRGAGRLAPSTARGVSHRSLPGLRVPQGSAGAGSRDARRRHEVTTNECLRLRTISVSPGHMVSEMKFTASSSKAPRGAGSRDV